MHKACGLRRAPDSLWESWKDYMRTQFMFPAFLAALDVVACFGSAIPGERPILFGGTAVELRISQVTQRTARLELLPVDDEGHVQASTGSTVLVRLSPTEKLRLRKIPGEKVVNAGQLQFLIKPHPLTVAVRSRKGELLQELVLDESTNAEVRFRAAAP